MESTKTESAQVEQVAAKLEQTKIETEETKNQEEEKTQQKVKGMKAVENKNFVLDLQSKKHTWETLNVPEDIREGLEQMCYTKPSIIQGASIPHVLGSRDTNFMFQAINGSGKTGAFAVPSLMRVDINVSKT